MADDKRTGPVDRRTQAGEEEAKRALINKRSINPPGRRKDDLSVKIRRLREDRQGFKEYFTDQVAKINKSYEDKKFKKIDPEAAEFKRFSKRGVRVKPTIEPRPGTRVGLHYSSNMKSLTGKRLESRNLGFSVARTPDEMLNSPTLKEPKGDKGVALVKITGKGLDATRPDDRLLLHKVASEADRRRSALLKKGFKIGGIDTLMRKQLLSMGVDFVDNWAGLGVDKKGYSELHVLNQKKVKVLKTVKATGLKFGKSLASRIGKLSKKKGGILGLGFIVGNAFNAGMDAYNKNENKQ